MILKKQKNLDSTPYIYQFVEKGETNALPRGSTLKMARAFSEDIFYTRGFIESLNWYKKTFTKRKEYLIAKRVSDNYSLSWKDALDKHYNKISENHNNSSNENIWAQSFGNKKQTFENLTEVDEIESWDSPKTVNNYGFSLEDVLSENFY